MAQVVESKLVNNNFLEVLTKTDLFSYYLYMVLGLYIFRIKHKENIVLPVVILMTTTLVSSILVYKIPSWFYFDMWYPREIQLYISASCLFYIHSMFQGVGRNKLITAISINSYAIYLLHVLILYVSIYVIDKKIKETVYQVAVSFFVIVASFIISYLLNKTPLRKILM